MLLPLVVVVVALAWVSPFIDRGWIPHDDGILALNARRVREGLLPARDYVDLYTGGLSFLFAGTQALLGDSILALRAPLVALFALFVGALFGVARKLLNPLAAALVVWVGVGWSLPNYTTPMPSWFNLFFGGLSLWALSSFLERRRRGWLVLAGAFGALSLLIKVIGLYLLGAGLLFLLYVEGTEARRAAPGSAAYRSGAIPSALFALVFAVALLGLIGRRLTLPDAIHFLVPGLSLAALVLVREWLGPSALTPWQRVRSLASLFLPFLGGAVGTVALYLVPYASSGSVGALYSGVFVLPQQRLQSLSQPPRGLGHLACALALAGLLAWLPQARLPGQRWAIGATLGALSGVAVWAGWNRFAYTFFWDSLALATPVVVALGCLHLARAPAPAAFPDRARADARLALVLIVTALLSLVQFPFAGPPYFLFVAPLVVLSVAALAARRSPPAWAALWVAALFGAYALLWLNPGFVFRLGKDYAPSAQTQVLSIPHAGIRVKPLDFEQYPALVEALAGAAPGEWAYAGPNSPEVYYLAGLRDPFAKDPFDPNRDPARFFAALEEHRVRYVVFSRGGFGEAPSDEVLQRAAARFPLSRVVGKFLVRWRE